MALEEYFLEFDGEAFDKHENHEKCISCAKDMEKAGLKIYQILQEIPKIKEYLPSPQLPPLYGDLLMLSKRAQKMEPEVISELNEVEEEYLSARNEFVVNNLRLVVKRAKMFRNRGLPYQDLVQEGTIGLMKATQRFDYRRGFMFSTYAIWWIDHGIRRSIEDHSRLRRVPSNMHQLSRDVLKTLSRLEEEMGEATLEDVAQELDRDPSELQKLHQAFMPNVSLDQQIYGESKNTISNYVADEKVVDPVEKIFYDNLDIEELFRKSKLTPMEKDILLRNFGIFGRREGLWDGAGSGVYGEGESLKHIGDSYQLSRERIRQIKEKALGKLRKCLD